MTNTPSTHTPACDMGCAAPVTHLGNKGYVYCATHAAGRRGVESTRKLRGWELHYLRQGRALPSYAAAPEPVAEVEPVVEDETDAMDQGEHIAVGDGADPLAVECDCGVTVTGATRGLTVAAWVRHCEGEAVESAGRRVPGENGGVRSVTYCKGHGWQAILGTLEQGDPEDCSNCTVRVQAVVPPAGAGKNSESTSTGETR